MASPSETLVVHRIGSSRFRLFDGFGAATWGGRWNSPGRPAIYAASTFAGAMLELLARYNEPLPPEDHVSIRIDIPGAVSREEASGPQVPGWDASDEAAAQAFGDAWLASGRSCVLGVPSVIVRPERNYVINPSHPDFTRITASEPEPVIWDERLFRR